MAMDIGAELRAAREAKGVSIATLAQRTRVQPRTLAAIEVNDVSNLPPRPFGRGFVKAYAEEVGLDAERTVQSFFSQFPPKAVPAPSATARRHDPSEPVWRPPAQWAGLGTAVAVLVMIVAAAVVLDRGSGPEGEPNAVGTTGRSPIVPQVSTPPTAAVPAAALASPIKLGFTVTGPCWVTATVDGERTIYRTLQPGESQLLNAEREILIRFGDAAAVKWTLNGREGSPLGTSGAIRTLRITPENAGTLR
jgi:cytoskeleton protein RodZ